MFFSNFAIEPPLYLIGAAAYSRSSVSRMVSRKASSPNVLSLKNMAWLPPAVMADRTSWSSSPSRVRVRLTRFPPVKLYRS